MQLSHISPVNFGLTIEKNQFYRTNAQKKFLKDCTSGLYNPLIRLDSNLQSDELGDVLIKEDPNGNSTISVKLTNQYGKEVITLKEEFKLKENKRDDIRAQLNDFIESVKLPYSVVREYSNRSAKKIKALINIAQDAKEFEESCLAADWVTPSVEKY